MPDLNHKHMCPPFLRVVDKYPTPLRDRVVEWDLRPSQPNNGKPVISDVVGFAASLYRGGVHRIVIPTTLVGMVDAGIAAKTAITLTSSARSNPVASATD